jgi:hypothetical protein
VRITSFPSIVEPRSRSSVVSSSVERFELAPVRKSFRDCSIPERKRACVE